MNTALLRFILDALRALGELGAAEERILRDARAEGFVTLTAPALLTALRQLADQRYVTPYTPPLGGQRWRITALGTSALAEQGV